MRAHVSRVRRYIIRRCAFLFRETFLVTKGCRRIGGEQLAKNSAEAVPSRGDTRREKQGALSFSLPSDPDRRSRNLVSNGRTLAATTANDLVRIEDLHWKMQCVREGRSFRKIRFARGGLSHVAWEKEVTETLVRVITKLAKTPVFLSFRFYARVPHMSLTIKNDYKNILFKRWSEAAVTRIQCRN